MGNVIFAITYNSAHLEVFSITISKSIVKDAVSYKIYSRLSTGKLEVEKIEWKFYDIILTQGAYAASLPLLHIGLQSALIEESRKGSLLKGQCIFVVDILSSQFLSTFWGDQR